MECPLGSYVLRHIYDDRYGPASSSSLKSKDGEEPYEKVRPCFVTFVDGPFIYVAPMLGASEKSDHAHFKPFLVSNIITLYPPFSILTLVCSPIVTHGTGGCRCSG